MIILFVAFAKNVFHQVSYWNDTGLRNIWID